MRRLTLAFALSVVAVLGWSGPAAAGATACGGPLEPFEPEVLVGEVDGHLVVPEGRVCLLAGAQLAGDASVEPGAGLITDGATIAGNLRCRRCLFLDVVGKSTVGGNLTAKGLLDGLFVHDSTIGGHLDVQRSHEGNFGFEFLRVRVGGNFEFVRNTGRTAIADSLIGGKLAFSRNVEGPFELAGNTIGGKLACWGNDPPPSGSENTAVWKHGQCREL